MEMGWVWKKVGGAKHKMDNSKKILLLIMKTVVVQSFLVDRIRIFMIHWPQRV